MERKEYEMSDQQLSDLMAACKPVPYMIVGGQPPRSQQDNANAAWAELGNELGFDHMSVKPTGKGDRFFSAMPK